MTNNTQPRFKAVVTEKMTYAKKNKRGHTDWQGGRTVPTGFYNGEVVDTHSGDYPIVELIGRSNKAEIEGMANAIAKLLEEQFSSLTTIED